MKVLDEITGLTFEDDPPLWPFQQMVRRRADAAPDCGCVDECRCKQGIQPRVTKAVIYHQLRKLGRWEKAGPARVAFVRRLQSSDAPKRKADELAWRLLEDMLFWNEGEAGFDLAVIDAELDAMLAYGDDREFPERPSEADVASTLVEVRKVFGGEGCFGEGGLGRLPTTAVYFYKRLGLWDLASRYLQRNHPDGDEIENVSTSTAWRVLARLLRQHESVAEIAGWLKRALAGPATHVTAKDTKQRNAK